MKRAIRLSMMLLLLATAGSAQAPPDLLLLAQPGEVLVGPQTIQQTISGVPISMVVSAFLSAQRDGDQVLIHARIIADLSDLQHKVGSLVDTLPWPTDNCAHFGVDNLVARVWGKELTVSGEAATLKLTGDVDAWTCSRNPVPCTKLDWDEKKVFGGTIRVPRVVSFDCNPPIKLLIADQPFTATLPVSLAAVSPQSVAVVIGNPQFNLGGKFGGVTAGILRIAGVDINERAREALQRAINPELLKKSLPDEALGLELKIVRARLLSNSGRLAAALELSATVAGKEFDALVRLLLGQQGSGQ